ncbi:hypothetical protein [Exiguobacterium aurantiacum]|uniref:DUF5666 domain-containing protein n=1 Tax=Exiguobacterium aurantiacum TaxID=33987 RepID=A0ABY5FP70_9BACL|nr:hypothetical protein [Exiguobacterium aurantiacum]UTT43361.1 hypothetical protein NMQ00_02340 [Exiguobacterium aurantiacum]
MKLIGWILGVGLAVLAVAGIGLYVANDKTDTVIVPRAVDSVNSGTDDAADEANEEAAASSESSASSDVPVRSVDDDDYELYGTLVSLSDRDVTISFSGKEATYPLAARHEIDDDTPKAGDRVKLEFNQNEEVKEVDRESDDFDIYGTFVSLSDREIAIERDGKTETFPLADRYEIDDETPKASDRVKLELNLQGQVKEIEREDDRGDQGDDDQNDDRDDDDQDDDQDDDDDRDND